LSRPFPLFQGIFSKTPDLGPLQDAIGVPKYLFYKDREDEFPYAGEQGNSIL